ncbi:glycosyltransferase [Paenibacillus sp. 1P07SE]|uniref:glycosyltransferase n=1 Tax=Paenibacillus sp. 1P07SE TaxID=3132209 RepID=UPI0039A6DC99
MLDSTWMLQLAGTMLALLLLGKGRRWQEMQVSSASSKFRKSSFNKPQPAMPTVSIIIPARNEESNLRTLLPLLKQQQANRVEILVVDDSSTDGTAQTAAAMGARVVQAPPLPSGWQGKSWACWTGAAQATGSWFIFLDADTRPSPDFVAYVGRLLRQRGGWLTIQPYHEAPSFREQWSAFFNAALAAGSGALSVLPGRRTAFGPCAVCWRSDYEAVGGHHAVHREVLEHLELGKRFRQQGMKVSGTILPGVLRFRMYPHGWQELISGWTKSIAIGAGASSSVYLTLTVAWMTALLGCAVQLGGIPGLWVAGEIAQAAGALGVYLTACASVALALRNVGTFRWYTALVYPGFLVFFIGIFAYAAVCSFVIRRVSWKGRTLDVR